MSTNSISHPLFLWFRMVANVYAEIACCSLPPGTNVPHLEFNDHLTCSSLVPRCLGPLTCTRSRTDCLMCQCKALRCLVSVSDLPVPTRPSCFVFWFLAWLLCDLSACVTGLLVLTRLVLFFCVLHLASCTCKLWQSINSTRARHAEYVAVHVPRYWATYGRMTQVRSGQSQRGCSDEPTEDYLQLLSALWNFS